jgi:hypothetical protein
MKDSTKQILKITLNLNRVLHRTAIRSESEHTEFDTGSREERIADRGWSLGWKVGQLLTKAMSYQGIRSNRKTYYNYESEPIVFIIMMSIYWAYTRFASILTGAKIPSFKIFTTCNVSTNWEL